MVSSGAVKKKRGQRNLGYRQDLHPGTKSRKRRRIVQIIKSAVEAETTNPQEQRQLLSESFSETQEGQELLPELRMDINSEKIIDNAKELVILMKPNPEMRKLLMNSLFQGFFLIYFLF